MTAWEWRGLAELLRLEHPLLEQFKEQMDAIEPGLWRHLERTPSLAPEQAEAVVDVLLTLACQCQNMLNLELGNAGLLALPRPWLLARIEADAAPLLELDDGWEYRRLLEVYERLDPALARRLAERGATSSNDEIREAADDWLAAAADA